MIRQDYILRLVAEMAQVLARVLLLKSRREYEQALGEIREALNRLQTDSGAGPGVMSVDDWVALCRKHKQAASGLLVAVGDLLGEQGDLCFLQERVAEGVRAYGLSLGLLLEALLAGETFVSLELLDKVERMLSLTQASELPVDVLRRLVRYFEARTQFGRAEDTLFSWVERGDGLALVEGKAFYERLLALGDAELERGELPRAEAEQGLREILLSSSIRT